MSPKLPFLPCALPLLIGCLAGCLATVTTDLGIGTLSSNGDQVRDWRYYHPGPDGDMSERLAAEGSYENDRQDGTWTYWHPDGKTRELVGNFENNLRNGTWEYWFANGNEEARGTFVDGFEDGEWTFWHESGERSQRGQFANGKRNLIWTYWHADGWPKAEGFYVNDEKVGTWRFWDEHGRPSTKAFPLEAGLELVRDTWEAEGSGTVRREGLLRDGRHHGRWLTRHENGVPRLAVSFIDGIPEGPCIATLDDGGLLATGQFRGGLPYGTWSTWSRGEKRRVQLADEWEPADAPAVPSRAGIADDEPVHAVVRTWLAEVVEEAERVRAPGPTAATPPPALETATEEKLEARTKRQPWTKEEKLQLSIFETVYSTGWKSVRNASGRYRLSENRRINPDMERSRALLDTNLPVSGLFGPKGEELDLNRYRGDKNLLIIVAKGFFGRVCPYCLAQLKALLKEEYRETFPLLNTEVVFVYPGKKANLEAFVADIVEWEKDEPIEYTMAFDPSFEFVNALGIKADWARPTSLIVDTSGTVRYAMVGQDEQDRPSVEELVAELQNLVQ